MTVALYLMSLVCVAELGRKVNTLEISVRSFRLSHGSPVAGCATYGVYR
jgi:hypothetical protein